MYNLEKVFFLIWDSFFEYYFWHGSENKRVQRTRIKKEKSFVVSKLVARKK